MIILSSNDALYSPSLPFGFLITPLIPLTVCILAFKNLVTSKSLVNIFLISAEFLNISLGSPTNLSFFCTLKLTLISVTIPFKLTLNSLCSSLIYWTPNTPEWIGTIGPYTNALQWRSLGVYLRYLALLSSSELNYIGIDWNLLHPTEKTRGSLDLSNLS